MSYRIPGDETGDPTKLVHVICVISDTKDHFAYTIHAFLDELMTVVKKDYPLISYTFLTVHHSNIKISKFND